MLAVAESEAEVRALLERDIYSTSGVWDLENAQIIPVCLSPVFFLSFLWIQELSFVTDLFGFSLSLLFGRSFDKLFFLESCIDPELECQYCHSGIFDGGTDVKTIN